MSEGFVTSDSVNTCDECWDMLNNLFDDTEEMYSDADPGLQTDDGFDALGSINQGILY